MESGVHVCHGRLRSKTWLSIVLGLLLGVQMSAVPGFDAMAQGAPAPPGSRQEQAPAPAIEVRENLVYREIDGQRLGMDACLPVIDASAPKVSRAAVLMVHGGGWHGGDKAGPQWRAACEQFARQGFVALSANYRLAPEHVYPAAIDDLDAALRWLREPAQVTSLAIDPARIGAFGGSAGGNLVGLLGSRGEGPLSEGSRLAAVVSLSGPMVLTPDALAFDGAEMSDASVVLAYLGCRDLASCMVAADASPITHVDPTDPPYLLVNSDREQRVVQEQAESMGFALDAAGVENEVIIVPGSEHAMSLFARPEISTATIAFFHKHLDASPATPVA